MKHYYNFLLLAILFAGLKTQAQCSSCTTTISGADASNYTILSGQTLCIAASGNASGNITVSPGGTLCNQGTISSSMVWVAGGTYNNYGTQTTDLMTVSNAGAFYNHGNATIDSLLITGLGSSFNNMATGTLTGVRFSDVVNAVTYNFGTITEDFMADSVGTFTNGGTITVNFDFGTGYSSSFTNTSTGILNVNRDLGNAYGTTTFTNNGDITIGRDFYNSNSAVFTNNKYWSIGRDFYNSTAATVTTNCMASVARDWYNSADVFGAANPSCGGFSIAGVSLNSGTLGNTSTHLDLCDAGHPGTGIDGNSGTIATTTTFCICTNPCTSVGIHEITQTTSSQIINIYPNPTNANITILINNSINQTLLFEIKNMLGQIVYSNSISASMGNLTTELETSNLSDGTYILSVADKNNNQAKKLFQVKK